MTTLGYSSVNTNSNQILQPNIAGGANPSNSHFTDPGPQFSSIVGGVSGYGGAGGSAAALRANPGYNVEKIPYHHQKGGGSSSHRRGGYKRSGHKKRSGKKRSNKKRQNKRSMRGGWPHFTTCHTISSRAASQFH